MQLEIFPVEFLYQIAPTINVASFFKAATLIVGAKYFVNNKNNNNPKKKQIQPSL